MEDSKVENEIEKYDMVACKENQNYSIAIPIEQNVEPEPSTSKESENTEPSLIPYTKRTLKT